MSAKHRNNVTALCY
uniref:Uncharacterized protein n=1 Tax=Anguilla anguilla TaxID=7936 RepID=A0A0E9RGB8_ANGAN